MLFKPLRTELTDHNLLGTSLQNVKDQLRLTDSEEDGLLTEYIIAATDRLERWLGMNFKLGRNTNFYDYCRSCTTGYLITLRPFIQVGSLEYLLDGVYTELALSELIVQEQRLETHICLKEVINPDCKVADRVKIEFYLGFTKDLSFSGITSAGGTATVAASAHGLSTGDHIIVNGADQPEYNGYFEVTATDDDTLTYPITGSPASPATGLIQILASDVPMLIQLGIKQMVARMYANRGDCADECGDIPCGVMKLLRGYRKTILRANRIRYGCVCC